MRENHVATEPIYVAVEPFYVAIEFWPSPEGFLSRQNNLCRDIVG